MPTGLEIVTSAFREVAATDPSETLEPDKASVGLDLLNRLLDDLNAERAGVFVETFTSYTFTPNLSPHTIGPTGTFTVASRPVTVDGANVVLNTSTPATNSPIVMRDENWWLNQRVQGLESSFPTNCWYQPTWPDGSLWFWPVPQVNYDVQIMTRGLLTQPVTLATTISLPPGYWNALVLTAAEGLAGLLGLIPPPTLEPRARKARARVFANNLLVPRIATNDLRVSGGGGQRSNWDYLTGNLT